MPLLGFRKQLLGQKEWRPVGGERLKGEKSGHRTWHPERALLYLCSACRFARLSISGLLRRTPQLGQGPHAVERQKGGSYRALVLHHDVQLRNERGLLGAIGEGGVEKIRNRSWLSASKLSASKRRLVQQALAPAITVSKALPLDKNYAPAEWTFFVHGEEVCPAAFQEKLDQAYAVRRSSRRSTPLRPLR